MPKKLTVLGVLAAVVLGAFGVLRDTGTTYAGPGGPAQNFSVDANICYGTAPLAGPVCVAGTDTAVTANNGGVQWTTARVAYGSRLTLPVGFVPGDSSGVATANADGFGLDLPADGVVTGEVTAQVDIGCDDTANDILADAAGPIATWPVGWNGVDIETQIPTPAYVNHPFSWPIIIDGEATLTTLFAGGTLAVPITPDPIPLNVAVGASPYKTGLRASVAQLGGDPSAPGSYLCQDDPQDSSTDFNTVTTPVAPGIYATWTIYTSAIDFRTWTVSRIIDVQCINVGGSGDPLTPCTTDTDGDGLVDLVETESGTNPAVADSDGDGANDRDEMFTGTRPSLLSNGFVADCAAVADPDGAGPNLGVNSPYSNAADTDCDGQRDIQDNGADQTTGGNKSQIQDNDTDDNCPTDYNDAQLNTDSPRFFPTVQPVGKDASDPDQDTAGDACDTDDDNDSMDSTVEPVLGINPAPGALSFCATPPYPVGYALLASDPLDDDSDNDGALDGIECRHKKNPMNAGPAAADRVASGFSAGEGDSVNNQKRFYRTYRINSITTNDVILAANELDDIDSDGSPGDSTDTDSDTTAANAKVDGILDSVEVKFFGTRASSDDTDGDGCGDGAEDADVNGNRNIDVLDLGAVAGAATPANIRNPGGDLIQTKVNFDTNRNGSVDVLDLGFVAGHVQNCPDQGGVTAGFGPSPQP